MSLKWILPVANRLSIAALAAALLVAPGCKKDSESGGGGGSGAAVSGSAIKLFPADSEFVAAVNGPKLRKSKYFDMLQGLIKKQGGSDLERLEKCGLDVMNDFQSIMMGGNTKSGRPLVKLSGVPRAAFAKCAGSAEGLEVKEEGEFSVVTERGETKHLAWVDDNTFVGGPEWSKADLKKRLTADSGADSNEALAGMIKKTDSGAAIWFAFAPAGGKMPGRTPVDVKGVYGSVWLDGGIKLDVGARLSSEKEAKDVVKQANSQLPQAKAQFKAFATLIDKLEVSSSGSDVRLQLDLSNSEVDDLVKAAKEDPMVQMVMSMVKAQLGG